MEPGHEDREYLDGECTFTASHGASMEPGHEDREYDVPERKDTGMPESLNGARS